MRYLRLVIVAPIVLALQGCFFFFIPGSFIDAAADGVSGNEGKHCVAETANVGDSIRLPNGDTWKVAKLEGKSLRCREAGLPVRAKLIPA